MGQQCSSAEVLEHASSRKNKDSVRTAAIKGDTRKLSRLIYMRARLDRRCGKGGTPLHHASARGQPLCVHLLLSAGAKTETTCKDRRTPLHWASEEPDNETAGLTLLEGGASAGSIDRHAWTPLHTSAMTGNAAFVDVLLHVGSSNVNVKDFDHNTPLRLAIRGGHAEAAKLLVSAGADVNIQSRFGNTPLHGAASKGMDDVVACLLDAGADRDARNADGKSAVDMAYRASTRALLLALPTATVEPTPGNDPTIAEAVAEAVQAYANVTVAVPVEWSAVTAERETLHDFCAPAAATAFSPTPSISRSFRSMATSASSSTTLPAPTTPALAAVAASAPAATVMAAPAHRTATAVAPSPPPPVAVAATASTTTAGGPRVDIALDLPLAPTTPVCLPGSTAEPTATSSHGDRRPLAVPAE